MLKIIIYCHDYDLITISDAVTCIHHCKNPEAAIYWCSTKYDHAIKSQPNVKEDINHRLFYCFATSTFSIRAFR